MSGHRCPRRSCTVAGLPPHLFACKADWFALSAPVRRAIYATRTLGVLHPDRQAALAAAREEWGDRAPDTPGPHSADVDPRGWQQ